MRRHIALAIPLVVAASFSMTGCCYYELRDTLDTCSANLRCCVKSRMAWRDHNDAYDNHPYKSAFGHGFRDGYSAICNGGDGCPPSLPPRCYWNDCFGDCEGKPKVAAYFNGYSQGAYVAQAEGCGAGGRLTVRRPVYPGGAGMVGSPGLPPAPAMGSSTAIPVAPPVITTPNPPPPAAPAGGPTIPADPAYDNYDPDGLYYE